ncbi:hypothetical protein [Vitiosangium sp. GDMCC 1.1324]|uniref:hypothetical protein n=1 Tax=Vitiosangium sp. (strain GDMCC 1.1324) TaxID=2138576 RepID=UPI000D39C49F|nr:hypothetical protein [Vitiosangium sp. GDMCC 1.1324]PTL75140.1 hypothetical protein DAT35_56415 [Vitiosangium sp. GDMCC 1.1324]
MKKLFLITLCLTLPAFASEPEPSPSSQSTVETSGEENTDTESLMSGPVLLPYCWNLDQTSCSPAGATQGCTDGIYTDYVCTCVSYTVGTTRTVKWDCPEVR